MILNDDQTVQLRRVVESCIQNLYQNDIDLIQRGGMEQAVAFRFGTYLLNQCQEIDWLRGYDFDMEYNKNGTRPKRTPRRPNGVRPDLIIHTRNSNETNILVVEIKGWWNLEPREVDRTKLEDFTHQEGEYKYGLGVFLDLGKTECVPEYYRNY